MNTGRKRAGIYAFYDADGIADRCAVYFLNDFSKNIDRLIIVVNGSLSEEGRTAFEKYTGEIIIRENKGFDIWAYKTGIDSLGWDSLSQFDELVLANNTVFGPLFPLKEMFGEMEERQVDFWGITRHYENKTDLFGTNPYHCIPEHIQSYFLVFRKPMLRSEVFQSYWNNCPEMKTYSEACGLFETYITRLFSDAGFKWDTFVDSSAYRNYSDEPLRTYPLELICEHKCPIIKRRTFFMDRQNVLKELPLPNGRKIIGYLRQTQVYDADLIYENIIRTCHMADIVSNLNLINIVGSAEEAVLWEKADSPENVIYLSDPDLSEIFLKLIKSVADTAPDSDTIVIVNGGIQQQSSLMSAERCTDKKRRQQSDEAVSEICRLFEKQKYLGLLVSMPPVYGEHIKKYSHLWGKAYKATKSFLEQTGIHVPISEYKDPVTAFDGCFCFRLEALKPLLNYIGEYPDELLYGLPFIAQSQGYYTGIVLEEEACKSEILNLDCYLRRGIETGESQYTRYLEQEVSKYYEQTSIKWQIKNRIKRLLHIKEKTD